MKIHKNPKASKLATLLKRPVKDYAQIERIVLPILQRVQRGGDAALRKLALEYDHVELEDLWISEKEIEMAKKQVPEDLKEAIKRARKNIKKFHQAQQQDELEMEVMEGVVCSRRSVPIQNVGLYVPGGTAPLFSTVLMLGIPAKIAGCKEIILASPTNQYGELNPIILYTADLIGITRILKIGGAQAIAAMAYGTETVPKVDKVFGPGNQYVTAAKQLAARDAVAIDMPAGPSEVMVLVDDSAEASFAAADLLSQAEHGVDSQVVLVSTSEKKAKEIKEEVQKQLEALPRKDIAEVALQHSSLIVVDEFSTMLEITNEYGPEHLIINTENADELVSQVVNAGSVFVGAYTPESAGDYASGTNHTLPTNGWAKAYSGVSLDSFQKKITYQSISPAGLKKLGPAIEKMAAAELLEAHKNAVSVRLKSLES
ncbi:MAG: histidinol dehydrogenase [Cytophagales bacterium]|nr:histidinol dehydrogenase [Cytophagales bacterium]